MTNKKSPSRDKYLQIPERFSPYLGNILSIFYYCYMFVCDFSRQSLSYIPVLYANPPVYIQKKNMKGTKLNTTKRKKKSRGKIKRKVSLFSINVGVVE